MTHDDIKNPEQFNALFIERLEAGHNKEAASKTMGYIKDRIREASFADLIHPPQRVVAAELTQSVNHDTLVYIDNIEPGSRAMAVTFRGTPTAEYIQGLRYAIGFFTISSLKFEITEDELEAYRNIPITKIVEENSIKDMLEIKDLTWLGHVEACVEAMQDEGNSGAVAFNVTNLAAGSVIGISKLKGVGARTAAANNFTSYAIQVADVVAIRKLLKRVVYGSAGTPVRNGRLRPSVMLMTDADADDFDLFTMEQTGSDLQGQSLKEGLGLQMVKGLRIVRTIKHDILREGNIYVLAEQQFVGRNFVKNDIKFYVDKIENKIYWRAWMSVGMGFGNIAAIVKIELYGGAVTPTVQDSGYAVAIPMDEESLGAKNNKVAEGLTEPRILQY